MSAQDRKTKFAAAATRRLDRDAPPAGRTAIRTKPVRVTLDLDPVLYRELAAWVASAAAELDVPRLSMADALRGMIRATVVDKGISAEVTEILRSSMQ